MLDLLGLGLLVKHANRVAEAKEQRPSTVVLSTIVGYLGVEVTGAVFGYKSSGLQGAALGAVLGAAVAGTVILLLLHFVLPDRRAQAQGPASSSRQLVGQSCTVCQLPIASTIGAGLCKLCGAACHDDCTSAHMEQAHADVRKRSKKGVAAEAREAVSGP